MTTVDAKVKALIGVDNITLVPNDATGTIVVAITGHGPQKELFISGFKVNLQTEVDKLQDFTTVDVAHDVASHDLTTLLTNETNDVKDKFIAISDYASHGKLYAQALANDVAIAQVVVQTPFDPATRTMVFTITLAKGGAIAINNTQEITVTFKTTQEKLAIIAVQALTSADLSITPNPAELPSVFVATLTKANIITAIKTAMTTVDAKVKALIGVDNITLVPNDAAGTIVVAITGHGPQKELFISGFKVNLQAEVDKLQDFTTTDAANDVDGNDLTTLKENNTNVQDKFVLIADLPNFNLVDGVAIVQVVVQTAYDTTTQTMTFTITLAKGAATVINNTQEIRVKFRPSIEEQAKETQTKLDNLAPINIANVSGWNLKLPSDVSITNKLLVAQVMEQISLQNPLATLSHRNNDNVSGSLLATLTFDYGSGNTAQKVIQFTGFQTQGNQNIINDKTSLAALTLTAKAQTPNPFAKDATPSLDAINILLSASISAPLSTTTIRAFTVTSDNNAKTLTIVVRISDTGSRNLETITLTISGFISQADLDGSQLGTAVAKYLTTILQVANTRDANDAQKQFPSEAFDVIVGQTTFSVTTTKGVVNNFDGSIAYTYRAIHSRLATSSIEGKGIISGFQTNLTPSEKKVKVQEELDKITTPINSHATNLAPKNYGVNDATPHLDALVANKYGVDPTYTKEVIGDGQVTFTIVYAFGNGHTATKSVVIAGLKSKATIQRDNDNNDINEVAKEFVNSSIDVASKLSLAAVPKGTALDQTKAQALGIAWPNDIKETTITYSHAAIISNGILQVSIQITKGRGQAVIRQLAITITGIDAFKLTAEKRKVIFKINNLDYPLQNNTNYEVKLFNKMNEIKQDAINAINLIKILSQVAGIAHDEQVKVIAAIAAYKNSIFLNAKNKTSQYGNKIILGKTLGDFGLTMDEVNKLPEPSLKVVGARVEIAYQDYDFENNYIIATLTITANSQTQVINIIIKGFGQPKIALNAPTQVSRKEFEGLILPSDFRLPKSVTLISSEAFKWATLPSGFTIPNTVKTINDYAFQETVLPIGFKLPDHLTTINPATFYKATLPPGFALPNKATFIATWAFASATLSAGFAIPESVTYISGDAFENTILPPNSQWFNKDGKQIAQPLVGVGATIRLTNSIIPYGQYQDEVLPEDFQIPSSVTHIGKNAFKGATLPLGFTIPNSVTHIDAKAFDGVILPLLHGWFKDGEKVASPAVGATIQGVTHIGDEAFVRKILSAEFRIPNTVTHIGYRAFSGATLFEGFTLPNSVTHIGERAFWETILPPGFQLPNGVTHIGERAFAEATLPPGFTLPNTITHIGDRAFQETSIPEGFTLPNHLKVIGVGIFSNATLPPGFTLPDGTTHTGAETFYGATLSPGFTLPNSITHIGNLAFSHVKTLPKGFTLPNKVTHIGYRAFLGAKLPLGFTLPNSVTHIGHTAFESATLPEGFQLPNHLKTIANSTFWTATLPVGFQIPDSVTDIADNAFYGVKLPPLHGWFKDGEEVPSPVPGAIVAKK